jgi:hypothetical protein
MKVSLPDNRDIGEAVGDSNEGMKDAYDVGQAEMRINSAKERMRAEAEGARDAGKITESGNQGFGGPGSSRTVKAPKPAVVTKEELAKSGYDNLRDYLNAKQGLTRRKEKDPTAGDSPDKAAQQAADAIDATRDMRAPRYTPPGSAPKQTTQKPKPKVFMPSKPDNSFPGSKFAKGGSVSSASSRADGCATKGKTKGTMVKMNYGGKC